MPSSSNILSIAGLDPSCGAGLSMDIKTATKLGNHITTVPTCLTVQNSKRFDSINPIEVSLLAKQIEIILDDIEINIVKIGLLPNSEIILAISKMVKSRLPKAKIILDPIISSTTGKRILDEEVMLTLKETLIKQSYLITPNINEATLLSSTVINNLDDMKIVAKILQKSGAKNVLIKGGHLNEDENEIFHLLLKEDGEEVIIKNKRIKTELEVRGTGCMLSTAIACFLSQNLKIEEAIQRADDFVNQEIKKARKIGSKLIMV